MSLKISFVKLFTPNGNLHRYGFDPYRPDIANLYQKLQVGTQTINLAYKSVPQGATDMVYVEPLEGSSLNGVTYPVSPRLPD
jgi:hypothetical protein